MSRMNTAEHTVVELDEDILWLPIFEIDDPEIDQLDYLLISNDLLQSEPMESIFIE